MRGDGGGAEHFEQFRGGRPAQCRFDQITAERMPGVGGRDDRSQFAPRLGEVQLRIFHARHDRLAARVRFQERLLQRGRPADQRQQPQFAHRHDHARVERGVMGDVGRNLRHFGA